MSSIRASAVATVRPGWITVPVHRIKPVSTVMARVKLDLTSSVVQPAGAVSYTHLTLPTILRV